MQRTELETWCGRIICELFTSDSQRLGLRLKGVLEAIWLRVLWSALYQWFGNPH